MDNRRGPNAEPERSSSSRSTRSPRAAAASRAPTASSSSSRAACPATGCGPGSPSPSAPTRRATRSSCSARARIGSPTAAFTTTSPARERPGRGCPTSASSPRRRTRSRTALRRLGHLDGFELEPIEPAVEPWRYRNKLEYSFGERPVRSRSAFTAAAAGSEVVDARRLPAGVRGQQRSAQRGPGVGPRQRPDRLRPPRRCRSAAQPRRPRGPPHRRSCRPVSSPRPTSSRGRPSTCTR